MNINIVQEGASGGGINKGFMVVGNIGATSKMNYTIMGDSVNFAARLELERSENFLKNCPKTTGTEFIT